MKSIHKIAEMSIDLKLFNSLLPWNAADVSLSSEELTRETKANSVGGILLRESKNIDSEAENHWWKGRISTVDLLVLTSSDHLILFQKYFFLYCKTSCINEEVNCTELSPWVIIPCSRYQKCLGARAVVGRLTDLGAMLKIFSFGKVLNFENSPECFCTV